METKEIRIVCKAGKYSLRWVIVDADGEVEAILRDEVETKFRSLEEAKATLKASGSAVGKAIVHANACTSESYGEGD